jgi:hypothetical protein
MTVSAYKYMHIWRIYACMYRLEYMYQIYKNQSY